MNEHEKDERKKNEEDFNTLRSVLNSRSERNEKDGTLVSDIIAYFLDIVNKNLESSAEHEVLNDLYHAIYDNDNLTQFDVDTILSTNFIELLVSNVTDFDCLNRDISLQILLIFKNNAQILDSIVEVFPVIPVIENVKEFYSIQENYCIDLLKIVESILFSNIPENETVNEVFEALCNLSEDVNNKIKDQLFRCISTLIVAQPCACELELPNRIISPAIQFITNNPSIDGVVYTITSCIYVDHDLVSFLTPEIVQKIVSGEVTQCKIGFISVACSIGVPALTTFIAQSINWDSLFEHIDVYTSKVLDILTYILGEIPSCAEIYETHNLFSNLVAYVRNEDLDYDDFARLLLISFPFLSSGAIENLINSNAIEVLSDGISMTELPHIYAELISRFLIYCNRSSESLFQTILNQIDEHNIMADLEEHGIIINEDFSISDC